MTIATQPKVRIRVFSQDPLADFLEHLADKRYAAKTIRNYKLDLGKMQRELGMPLYLATAEDLNRYMSRLSRSSLKASSLQKKQAALRGFFKWAMKRRFVALDPCIDFVTPKKPLRLPIHLSDEDVAALFGAFRSDTAIDLRESALIATYYYTGCRASEVVGLDIERWFRSEGDICVIGKGNKERRIPVPTALVPYLERWLAFHPTGKGAMFTTLGPGAERVRYDTVRGVFNRLIARAGLQGKGYTLHKLRHTYATKLTNQDVRIEEIRDLLGHLDISTTQIYAHTTVSKKTREALGRIL